MKVTLKSDHSVTDTECKSCTGKTLKEWFKILDDKAEIEGKRRETINWLYEHMKPDAWWPTTIWVEYQRSKGVLLKDGRPDGYNICVTKTIAAPIDEVFGAWSDSKLSIWLGDQAKSTKDGSVSDKNGNRGEVTRVRPNKDIRYQWQTGGSPDASDVEVMFADKAGKVGITLNHNRIQSRDEADGLRTAWGGALTSLKKLLESK